MAENLALARAASVLNYGVTYLGLVSVSFFVGQICCDYVKNLHEPKVDKVIGTLKIISSSFF